MWSQGYKERLLCLQIPQPWRKIGATVKKTSADRDKNVEAADRMCACHATLLAPCSASSFSVNCVAELLLLLLCLAVVWIRSRKFESQSVLCLRKNRFPHQWGRWLWLVNIYLAVTRRPSHPPLFLFLGRLRGLDQSKPGGAPDDPWPAGCVEGSARTPVAIHVSCCHSVESSLGCTLSDGGTFFGRPNVLLFFYSTTLGKRHRSKGLIPMLCTRCLTNKQWSQQAHPLCQSYSCWPQKKAKIHKCSYLFKGIKCFFNAICRKIDTFSFCVFILLNG